MKPRVNFDPSETLLVVIADDDISEAYHEMNDASRNTRAGGHESSGIEHLFPAAEVEPSLTILVVAPDSSASPRSKLIAIDSISQSHR